jgi:hypothetical protein
MSVYKGPNDDAIIRSFQTKIHDMKLDVPPPLNERLLMCAGARDCRLQAAD